MVRQSNGRIRSIRGIGRVEVVSDGKKFKARQFMVLEKPDMMRVDLLSFLDLPYLRLAFKGDTFQAMDMRANVFYTGELARALSLFVPIRVTSREFIAFVFGEIPEQDHLRARYDPRRRLYELDFPPSTRWKSQTFWIHPKTSRVVEISKKSVRESEKETIRVSFSRFRKTGSMTFPTEVEIEVSGANNRIRFNFRKIEINPPLPREPFRLPIPPGAEVVTIDEGMRRPFVFPTPE